jgi:predicted RNase H-like HicB family nuclease
LLIGAVRSIEKQSGGSSGDMTAYIALLRKEPSSDFGVDFPDFPGCVTAGQSLEEARRMAAEALASHVEGMQQDGEPIPEPSALGVIINVPDGAIAFLIALPVREAWLTQAP